MKTIKDQYGNIYKIPGPYVRIEDIERANANAGQHFFDGDTMRFFSSRVSYNVFGGRVFVTSEKSPHGSRRYTIRIATDGGSIATHESGFQAFDTLAQAKSEARYIVE